MITIFSNIKIEQLRAYFLDENKCLAYIAEEKWKDGFVCRKCGNLNYCEGKKPFSRRCTRCKTEESATAHTIFHRCKIHLPTAFRLAHMVCADSHISTTKLSNELNLRPMTCWNFKKKISQCLDQRSDMSAQQKVELKDILLHHNSSEKNQ